MVKRVARGSERPKAFVDTSAGSSNAADAKPKSRSHATRSRAARTNAVDAAASPASRAVNGAGRTVRQASDALSSEMGGVATALAVGVGAALLEAELVPGIVLGAGAMLLGKVFPQLNEGMRPMLKAAVGAGLSMVDKTRSVLAEAGEQVHDVVAEVRSERQQTSSARSRKHGRARASDQDEKPASEG